MENKNKIKIKKNLPPPRRPEVAGVAHIALEACIYRLSNVEPHFINCIVDPQNYDSNRSLCRDIERFVAIELSVFIVVFVVASCFLSRLVL